MRKCHFPVSLFVTFSFLRLNNPVLKRGVKRCKAVVFDKGMSLSWQTEWEGGDSMLWAHLPVNPTRHLCSSSEWSTALLYYMVSRTRKLVNTFKYFVELCCWYIDKLGEAEDWKLVSNNEKKIIIIIWFENWLYLTWCDFICQYRF